DGRYSLALPLGDSGIWGIFGPSGYYNQNQKVYNWDQKAYIWTTLSASSPSLVRDFALQPGLAWQVQTDGIHLGTGQSLLFDVLRGDPRGAELAGRELMTVRGNARGQAVLATRPQGGRCRFECSVSTPFAPYDILPIDLKIDKDFDPRHIRGLPQLM